MSIGPEIGSVQNFGLNLLTNRNLPDWEKMEAFDWLQAMKECLQDAIWHAEGNVYIHTKMVVDALINLPEYQGFSEVEQQILVYSAIFHDVAKPLCTTEDRGRIVSPKHAKIGEKVTQTLLWGSDFSFREAVCSLVSLHGVPLWALEKQSPNGTVISSSLRLKNSWLYALSKADVLGRECEDKAELLEKVEYFKELCEENNCFSTPYSFENEHSKFQFFHKEDKYPSVLFDDTKFTVYMMSGLPGSGKDTYIRSHFADLPVISLDDLREEFEVAHGDSYMQGKIVAMAYEQAKVYARRAQSFVWNSTNLTKMLRNRLTQAMLPYHAKIEIIYLETDFEANVLRRKGEIPAKEMLKMQKMLDLPMPNEAYKVIYMRN